MNKRLLTGTGIALAAVLFGAFNMLSNATLRSARFDLTEHKLYTLSDGTKNVLNNLTEPITLRFYLSKKLATGLPVIKGYATRVQEMLEEYAQVAAGQLILQVKDPEPFSEEEDRAVGYGLQGVPLDNGSTQFYFGLAGTSSTDDLEVIPFFQSDREEFLEYDLTKLIHTLAHPKKKVLGLLSSLPMDGAPAMPFMQQRGGQPWLIVTHIEQMFEIKKIETTATTIPEDVSVLMVVHPKSLSDSTLYAIDQFVIHGGHAMIFVDPLAEADPAGANPMNPMGGGGPRNSDLPKLFEAWGLELVKGKVLGDLPLAKKVQIQQQARMQVVDYPVWVDFRQEHFSSDDIVTAQVPTITMASAGILQKKGDVETTLAPLIQSDEAAMKIDASRLSFMPDLPGILRSYTPEDEKMIVAARVTGNVKTAFPDGKPKEPPKDEDANSTASPTSDDEPSQPHVSQSKDPINVIVVADTDILQDKFWAQVQNFFGQRIGIPTSGNGTFITNALDNLTGSNDLISVRSRAGYARPFTLLRALQQDAEQQFRQKEQALQERLKDTERKLQDLQSQKPEGNAMIMSAEQQKAMATFRQDLVQVRKELRTVQHELGKNIESVESWVKFTNIGLVPILIGIVGVWISSFRLRKKSS